MVAYIHFLYDPEDLVTNWCAHTLGFRWLLGWDLELRTDADWIGLQTWTIFRSNQIGWWTSTEMSAASIMLAVTDAFLLDKPIANVHWIGWEFAATDTPGKTILLHQINSTANNASVYHDANNLVQYFNCKIFHFWTCIPCYRLYICFKSQAAKWSTRNSAENSTLHYTKLWSVQL